MWTATASERILSRSCRVGAAAVATSATARAVSRAAAHLRQGTVQRDRLATLAFRNRVEQLFLGRRIDFERLVAVGRNHRDRRAFTQFRVELDTTLNDFPRGDLHASILDETSDGPPPDKRSADL